MRPVDVAKQHCSHARAEYVQALDDGDPLFARFRIDTPLRLAHFLAQIFHESGGLMLFEENGKYSAKNLADMWDAGNWHKYFKSRQDCIAMAEQCKLDRGVALFSLVYGNRMGNGNAATKDGWNFRGRGLLQTTGRESYQRYSDLLDVDFVGKPTFFLDPRYALLPALHEWDDGECSAHADHDEIVPITKAINGGTVGINDRRLWLSKIKRTLGI